MRECEARLVGIGRCETEGPMTRIIVDLPEKPWMLHVCGNMQHQGIVLTGLIANSHGHPMQMEPVE